MIAFCRVILVHNLAATNVSDFAHVVQDIVKVVGENGGVAVSRYIQIIPRRVSTVQRMDILVATAIKQSAKTVSNVVYRVDSLVVAPLHLVPFSAPKTTIVEYHATHVTCFSVTNVKTCVTLPHAANRFVRNASTIQSIISLKRVRRARRATVISA